ncbi:hypothetical protein Q0590_24565 [Rhodocytophaga aerolata]|uniref:Uncharacterized protein n=1 Tax=Rhodocytophaga aerolata TaxID=455078 RepID=A0ABT8RFH9_9BACT|nr:hypothetical protein [Rhodocytophaga aerolata]MDO1449472.1 hypothetical protein [Rhodocytophaga aerolata]
MKATQKVYAVSVMVAFLLPNLYVMYSGHESFPFTHAPMFAHYIDETTLFYDFEFIGQKGHQETFLYPSYESPLPSKDRVIRRFFFNKVYGSMEASSFSHFEHDTQEQFIRRLELFFASYFGYLQHDTLGIQTVRLEVHQYNADYQLTEKHTLGYFDVSTGKFQYTWTNRQ